MTSVEIRRLQKDIQTCMDRAVEAGEHALQFTAYLHGEPLVDAAAAPAGMDVPGAPLFPFFSTGKGIAGTAVNLLVQRGALHWDDPVARYWPGFAAHGKSGILIRHLLNHTAGLPNMPAHGDFATVTDWDAMCAFFAGQVPLCPPGAAYHYHAISYGWLLGETVRRATGRRIEEIIATDILKPLGIGRELYFGVPLAEQHRCLTCEKPLPVAGPPPVPQPPPQAPPPDRFNIPAWVQPLEDWINDPGVRAACLPASNGFGTANAIARHYAALIGNGTDGIRILNDATLAEALRRRPGLPGGRALGYTFRNDPPDARGVIFGSDGHGGSYGFADSGSGLAAGFVKSRMGGDLGGRLAQLARSAVATGRASRG